MPDQQENRDDTSAGDQERRDGAQSESDTDARGDDADQESGADKLLKALKDERDARREAERKVRKFEQDQRKAETDRAVKAGEWESVAKAKDGEITDLTARLTELEGQIADRDRSIIKAKVAAKHKLPPELAELVRGDDEAAMDAHCKTLANLVAPPRSPDTEAGRGGQGDKATLETEKQAQLATGRYRSIA